MHIRNDGSRFIYFNTAGTKGGTKAIKQLRSYLKDSKMKNVTNESISQIHSYMTTVKQSAEGKAEGDRMKNMKKTNVMRILDQNKISYTSHDYTDTGVISGVDVAAVLKQNPDQVFKTLVTVGSSKTNYVFLVPVQKELNLKKAAQAVGEKSIEMIKSKELLPLTGYIHGGCSPIGMKKQFKTVIDASAGNFDIILFSGGKIGYQVEVAVADLKKVLTFDLKDIAE